MASRSRQNDNLEARVGVLEEALALERGVNQALLRVGDAIGASQDLDPLFQLIMDTTTSVLNVERGTLYLRRGDSLVSRVKKGDELATIEVSVGQGIAGHVAKTGRAARVADAYADARFDRSWDEQSGFRTRSILAVPLKDYQGGTVGVLQVLNKRSSDGRPSQFTTQDRRLLSTLATHAAVFLDKNQLFRRLMQRNEQLSDTTQQLERSVRDLELLYELETKMGRADTVSELARSVILLTANVCEANAGALLFASSATQWSLFVVNLGRGGVREVIVQPGEGIAGRAMTQNELLTIDDPRTVRDPRRVREMLGVTVRSAIAAPLVGADDQPVGALALYNHAGRPSRFTSGDGALLKLVSANVSTAMRLLDARQERERAERLTTIGRLLSGVLHDLRTPLTVVSGYMQLMRIADDPKVRSEYGETVREQFDIIATMQREVLAYARGETNVLIRKVYVGKFFENLAKQFRPELEERGVRLTSTVDGAATAHFDEGRMGRAFGNLIRNAIEAMPDGGNVELHAHSDDDDLVLTVTDNGGGIPKAIRNKVFEPFVTSGKKTGTGLGLANVREIVTEHGGRIEVSSKRCRTCFTIWLPQAAGPLSRRTPSP